MERTVVVAVTLSDAEDVDDASEVVMRYVRPALQRLAEQHESLDPHWSVLGPVEYDEAFIGVVDKRQLVA